MLSVCVCVWPDACLDVNQDGTDRNRCTQRLVVLDTMNPDRTPKLGQSELLYGSKSPTENVVAASWVSQSIGCLLLRPGRGVEYCDQPICLCVCMSASISLEPLDRSARFFVQIPCGCARSSSGGVALRYVLPVLWMTSSLAVMGPTPKSGGWPVTRLP